MTRIPCNPRGPSWAAALCAAVLATGCIADEAEIGASDHAVTAEAPPVTPEMEWLAALPAADGGEQALAALFANGTADHMPTGASTGYPVLFSRVTELNAIAARLWGGKTLRVVPGQDQANGDPVVRLDNKIIMTDDGAMVDAFDADVTRGTVAELAIGTNGRGQTVAPPQGVLPPMYLSFLDESVVIDDRPSVLLNYFEDRSLPVIRRILDEIREIDGEACPGLYLGRAHVRRCTSLNCGELPSPLVDSVSSFTFATRYEWNFWTYFLLNFSDAEATCDLEPALARLTDGGAALPPRPVR